MKVMQEGEVLMAFPHSRNRLLRFYEWLRLTYYRYCLWTAVYVMTTGIPASSAKGIIRKSHLGWEARDVVTNNSNNTCISKFLDKSKY
ncbi:hypothetical protein Gasu2_01960 [Galdieria sulphuraria]|nr:hypothetical protein Gasu2_01960 [Galdieria sulphuraria]